MDQIKDSDISNLIAAGNKMYEDDKKKINKFIESLLDSKYGNSNWILI